MGFLMYMDLSDEVKAFIKETPVIAKDLWIKYQDF
jgi:hypothetical protein